MRKAGLLRLIYFGECRRVRTATSAYYGAPDADRAKFAARNAEGGSQFCSKFWDALRSCVAVVVAASTDPMSPETIARDSVFPNVWRSHHERQTREDESNASYENADIEHKPSLLRPQAYSFEIRMGSVGA